MPSATKLQKLLLAPPSKNTMWSLTDLTYRGRFTESGAALAALMRYTLSIASTPAPLQAHWASPKVSAALAACDGCHATRPAKGDKHRCPQLSAKSAALRCARCHGGDKTPAKASISKCPSVRAAAPLCKTCHLRDQ